MMWTMADLQLALPSDTVCIPRLKHLHEIQLLFLCTVAVQGCCLCCCCLHTAPFLQLPRDGKQKHVRHPKPQSPRTWTAIHA